jgi:hypothetical protein
MPKIALVLILFFAGSAFATQPESSAKVNVVSKPVVKPLPPPNPKAYAAATLDEMCSSRIQYNRKRTKECNIQEPIQMSEICSYQYSEHCTARDYSVLNQYYHCLNAMTDSCANNTPGCDNKYLSQVSSGCRAMGDTAKTQKEVCTAMTEWYNGCNVPTQASFCMDRLSSSNIKCSALDYGRWTRIFQCFKKHNVSCLIDTSPGKDGGQIPLECELIIARLDASCVQW